MKLRNFLIAYLATALVFLMFDAVWLTLMSERLYRPALGSLLLPSFDVLPAALFYGLYFAGVVVFVVAPSLGGAGAASAPARGALFGLVAYATYDLTNQATLRDWPWRVTLADLCWGAFVTASAAAAAAGVITRRSRGGRANVGVPPRP